MIENKKMTHFKIFEIEKKQFNLEFDEEETYIECENNLTIHEFEQTFCLGENIKIFSNMKKPNPDAYIKDVDKFQITFKDNNKQYLLCSLIEKLYTAQIFNKLYVFLGKCFNGWNIYGLNNYTGLSMGSKNNDFKINFTNVKYDTRKNIAYFRIPEKINDEFIINAKGKIP
jgi:hypothetical protein